MEDKRFNELMSYYLDGEISEKDLVELHRAINDNPEYRKHFQKESRLNVLMREAMSEEVELNTLCCGAATELRLSSRPLYRILSTAAAILIIAGILVSTYVIKTAQNEDISMGTCMYISGSGIVQIERNNKQFAVYPETVLYVGDQITCDSRMQAMLRLSDDSILSLEPNSSLTLISDQPLVRLDQGEVLFEIAERQAGMPAFEVITKQSKVDVMGTVFTLEASEHTQLKVYEGSVNFIRNSDNMSVEVAAEQMASTDEENLSARNISSSFPDKPVSVLSLLPTDDVTIESGKIIDGGEIKVQGNYRTAYLRFEIPQLGTIHSAKLRLTQKIDPGSGTLRFFRGNHSHWNEIDMTESKAPFALEPVVERTGVVQRHEVIEVEVSRLIPGPGAMTIIITLDKGGRNDIWFGSRESSNPPQLILTFSNTTPIYNSLGTSDIDAR